MPSFDYKTVDDDLFIENGDFVVEDRQQDHIRRIMLLSPGSLRQYPLVGVNLLSYVNSPWSQKRVVSLNKNIKFQLLSDGYNVSLVDTTDPTDVKIQAEK